MHGLVVVCDERRGRGDERQKPQFDVGRALYFAGIFGEKLFGIFGLPQLFRDDPKRQPFVAPDDFERHGFADSLLG